MSGPARNKQDDLQPEQAQALRGAEGGADMPGGARRGSPYKKNQATQYGGNPAIEAAGPPPAAPAVAGPEGPDIEALLEALKEREIATNSELEAVLKELGEDREKMAFLQSKLNNPADITQEDLERLRVFELEADTPKDLLRQGISLLDGEVVAGEELLPQFDEDLQSIAEERAALEEMLAAQQGGG